MRVVLVDGGSGAGKTTFARRLADLWHRLDGRRVQLVSLDDCYPGWHGLEAASRMLADEMLRPHHAGYRRWDWQGRQTGPWVPLDPNLPLLVEGCGAITPASVAAADLSIWLEMPEPERRRRALGRDGDAYAPWWETWAAQEREHWRRDNPRDLADLLVFPPTSEQPLA